MPGELLHEIFKRLDWMSIKNMSLTCKYFKQMVETYKTIHKDVFDRQEKDHFFSIFGHPDDCYDDYIDDYDTFDDYDDFGDAEHYNLGEMIDAVSLGSNYDEDLVEYLESAPADDNSDPGRGKNEVQNSNNNDDNRRNNDEEQW